MSKEINVIICNPQFTCFPSSKEVVPSVEILLLYVLVSYTELCLVGILATLAGSVLVSNSWVLCETNAVFSGLSALLLKILLLCLFAYVTLKTYSKVKSVYLLHLRSNSVSVKSDQWSLSYNIYAIWCWCLLVNNLFNCVPFCDQLNFIK